MEKEKILKKIQQEAGTISADSVCKSCATLIKITDALALFPHCPTTQGDVRDILESHSSNNCNQNNSSMKNRCQGRRDLITKFLNLCEEDHKIIDN